MSRKKLKAIWIDDTLIFIRVTKAITDLKYLLAYSASTKKPLSFLHFVFPFLICFTVDFSYIFFAYCL